MLGHPRDQICHPIVQQSRAFGCSVSDGGGSLRRTHGDVEVLDWAADLAAEPICLELVGREPHAPPHPAPSGPNRMRSPYEQRRGGCRVGF
ncbi:hypothetical protein D5S18_25075 [Nocardia panacis]|uniref:Uncharacterized protein n=1 Tax=Nocardia panacis TaxID=2340916 RepID=A0A3A4KED0_9NOCA|nr:hypothetical protein D5S18_25075 [Nocardia panacis]